MTHDQVLAKHGKLDTVKIKPIFQDGIKYVRFTTEDTSVYNGKVIRFNEIKPETLDAILSYGTYEITERKVINKYWFTFNYVTTGQPYSTKLMTQEEFDENYGIQNIENINRVEQKQDN